MNAQGPADLGALYRDAKPLLDAALADFESEINRIARSVPEAYVVGRVKSARSLVRKLRDGSRSWDSVTDKIGLRVICTTRSDVRVVDRLIDCGPWQVLGREVKSGKDPDRLFYPGTHFEICNQVNLDQFDKPIVCEVQIRTRAQDAWSVASHKLTYKGPVRPPKRMLRAVQRLTVLVELFDEEISRAFKKRAKLPTYRPAILSEFLDGEYEAVCEQVADAAKDLEIVSMLLDAYRPDEKSKVESLVEGFVRSHADLAELIKLHSLQSPSYVDRADWLFTQPEVLIVLERAEARPHQLLGAVADTDLEEIVRRTCVIAGNPLPE